MEEEQFCWMRYNMNYTIFLSDTAVMIKAAGIIWLGHVIGRRRHLHLNVSFSLNPRLQTSRATKTVV
jgi:TRAP-type C4-dicarboxylate transport system permease small subunit